MSDVFTFIQMNFWIGRLFYPIDKFLKTEKPDIFSAQEMLSGPGDLTPDFWTAETLVAKEHFDAFSLNKGMPSYINKGSDNYSIQAAIFTRNPAKRISEKNIMLFENPDDLSEKEKNEAKLYSLLHNEIQLPNQTTVHVLTHHGRLVKGESGRIQHPVGDYNFKKIADYISTLKGPVILSGDFNLVKEAISLNPLKEIGLANLNDVHNVTEARNEFSWRPHEAVSHVYVNNQIIVSDYRVARENVSDHYPLVMKFQVKQG